MIIGVPKEIKNNEYRVAITPDGVKEFVRKGHKVLIETGAGVGSQISDEEYKAAGAEIVDKDTLFNQCEMVYKVKEFFPQEFKYLREGLIIFTYIHSNAHREQTDAFIENKVIGISYEDVEDKDGGFPLLAPMSEIAGKGGFLKACEFMQIVNGGAGMMLSRIPGIKTPEITIIGAGNSGFAAAEFAASLGNKVTILDINIHRMQEVKYKLPENVELLVSNEINLIDCLKRTDVLINCINWPKWRKDHIVYRDMLKLMKKGAMIVDVACDDEGAVETCRSTTHDDPIYFEEGILHYCVDNIPAAFPRTSSYALCNATLPYALEIAGKGPEQALKDNQYLRKALSFYYGELTLAETGLKQNRPYKTPEEVLGI